MCTGIGATLKEVVDIIGVKYLLNRKKIREPKVVIGNNNKIKKALNWNIKFDVKKGIRKLI